MKFFAGMASMVAVFVLGMGLAIGDSPPQEYVGSQRCEPCHSQEYENFMEHASKARSDENVQLMLDKLTPAEQRECYECHTTGYGEPGGFESFEETPELGHAGCEVCHGPGSEHSTTADPDLIQADLSIEEHCAPCHEDERVQNINYKPLLYSGAH